MKYDVLRVGLLFSWFFCRLVAVQSEECSSTDAGSCSTPLSDIIQVTGSRQLEIHRSNLKIEDGNLLVVGNDDNDHNLMTIQSKTSGMFQASVVEIQGSKSATNYDVFKVMILDQCLFNIKQDGAVNIEQNGLFVTGEKGIEITQGKMHILKGSLVLGDARNTAATTMNDKGIQVLDGDLNLEKGNLVLQNGAGSITRSSSDLHSLLSLTLSTPAPSHNSPSSVLHIHGNTSSSQTEEPYLLTAGRDDTINPVFSIHSSGTVQIERGGLHVAAGGLHVHAGGQVISSGGLTIESGGLDIQSGTLTTRDGFDIANGGLRVSNEATAASVLSLRAANPNFSGTTLVLTSASSSESRAFETRDAQNHTTSSLRHDGELFLASHVRTSARGNIIAGADLITRGRFIISATQVDASDDIVVPNSHGLVQILDDGHDDRRNDVHFDNMDIVSLGQTLVIQNQDAQPVYVRGVLELEMIPSAGLVSLVFDGTSWQPLSMSSSMMSSCTHDEPLSQAPPPPHEEKTTSDVVRFGPVTLSAKDVQVASQTSHHVAYYGAGGKLSGHESLTFREGILDVPILRTEEIIGRVNASHAELVNVQLLGGHLRHVHIEAESIVNHGDMTVASNALIGGGLTVNGVVMGSGAYVDISDKRFKHNIASLARANATNQLWHLEGVAYDLRTQEFPEYHFSTQRQFGFIADDVARYLPELITVDAQGFKRMAYSRMVPLIVEAMKEQRQDVATTHESLEQARILIARLEQSMEKLAHQVETLHLANDRLIKVLCARDVTLCQH